VAQVRAQFTKEIQYPDAIYHKASDNTAVVVSFRGVLETWSLNQNAEPGL
jgi:hypothetical protein